jgi:hypothetical protein
VADTAGGGRFSVDIVFMLTLVEEDGELKVLNCKAFADAEKRSALFTWADKAQAQGSATS